MDISTRPDSALSIPDAGGNLCRHSPIAPNWLNRRASNVILDIRSSAIVELRGMEQSADLASRELHKILTAYLEDRLEIILGLSESDGINLFRQLNVGGLLRHIDVYPLAVVASMSLDKTVGIVAGEDPMAKMTRRLGRSEVRIGSGSLGRQKAEFKEMVGALHEPGIEVILDLVFNRAAEGDELGPALCFRGTIASRRAHPAPSEEPLREDQGAHRLSPRAGGILLARLPEPKAVA